MEWNNLSKDHTTVKETRIYSLEDSVFILQSDRELLQNLQM